MGKLTSAALFLSLLITTAQAASLMYVNSKKVNIYQQADYKSPVVTELKKGDELQVIQQGDKWIKVKNASVSGWVPGYSLTDNRPSEEKVSIFNRIKNFFGGNKSRSRVSTISTAGGIRGLSEEEGEASGKKDFQEVEKMEQIKVTDEDVEKFEEETKQ